MRLVVLLVSLALAAASPQQGILVGSGQANSLGTGGPPCGSRQCDPGYIKFGELCYKLAYADSPLNYNQAIAACRREKALLASPKTTKEYENLRVLGEGITEAQDIQTRRAFIGMFCGVDCVEPSRWRYADGERCTSNMFCDWSVSNTINEWNSIPSLAGASVAALLDGKEQFPYKIQAFPGDHRLQYFICQKSADNLEASKPNNLRVSELVSWIRITWDRPACEGDLSSYIMVVLGGTTSYDTEIKCDEQQCTYDMNPAVCDYCIKPNVDYTFSVAAVLEDSQLGPAATVNQAVDVETCPNFVAPLHTTTLCRGVSEVNANGDCNNQVLWSKGSMCQAQCEEGYGFFDPPAKKYSCGAGGQWSPDSTAPECYQIVPVYSANLQYKITYQRESIESLQHQFDGLVYKYNDIFCPYPEECGVSDLSTKASLDNDGRPLMDVVLTIDTPVYNITDQEGFVDIVSEALSTVTEDNAFMTLIDYDNIELVLPIRQRKGKRNKAMASLCCHKCPEGHAYRLGHCVKCPSPNCN
ncbi:uncharacterized protein LOC119112937 isoform X2 [Pollicipes pollicipes]|uniref:uncharacterized protein LOC119112937 isoform X2 n=1 Tax=Pollicipes pollicipes TaxID=41117 RepID=UPI001884DC4C|nr:uncharacterized protein LOC119112937 isoform X2 [Pollicipes pollicipes]